MQYLYPVLYILMHDNVLNGYINYSSDDTWYLASVENPDEVIAFTKDYVNEYAFGIDEKHLLSNYLIYDSEEDHFTENAYVYDMTNGGLCAYISPSMYGEDYSFTFLACGEEMLLFQVSNEDRSVVELCLWDIEELHAETPHVPDHLSQGRPPGCRFGYCLEFFSCLIVNSE